MSDLLITQDEIESLPDDPRERFVRLEEICRRRHYDEIAQEQEWAIIQDSQLKYMSTVVAAAKYLEIEPVCSVEIPLRKNFSHEDFRDFVLQIQLYTVQLMLESAERKNRTAIMLEGSTRDRLLTLTSHLRDQIRKLELPPARIEQLIKRINEFEKELRQPRLRLVTVALVTLAIAGAIADVGGATEVVRKLISQIEETVGKAKDEQDKEAASRLLPSAEVRKLAPPPKETPPDFGRSSVPASPTRGNSRVPATAGDLDDDIPFK
jgi:hypothetical protein